MEEKKWTMEERPWPLNKFNGAKPPRRLFDRTFPIKHDVLHILRGQALVIDVLGVPEASAHAIEERMGWVKPRYIDDHDRAGKVIRKKDGVSSSNTIAPAISGKHALSSSTLDELEVVYHPLRITRELPLWQIIAGIPFDKEEHLGAFDFLDDNEYWIFHDSPHEGRGRRWALRFSLAHMTETELTRLALAGTLTAISALSLHVRFAIDGGKQHSALYIAQYIPAALALYGARSARALRLAILLFAQLRCRLLDAIRVKDLFVTLRLDLRAYDFLGHSRSTSAWANEDHAFRKAPDGPGKVREPVPDDLKAWLKQALAPIACEPNAHSRNSAVRKVVVFTGLATSPSDMRVLPDSPESPWAEGMGPYAWLINVDAIIGKRLHASAMDVLHESLGDLWGHPRGSDPGTLRQKKPKKRAQKKRRPSRAKSV
jgi:hypothetical protein